MFTWKIRCAVFSLAFNSTIIYHSIMKNLFILAKQFGKVGIAAALSLVLYPLFGQEAEIKNAERLTDQDKKKQAVEVLQKATETYPTATYLFYHLGQAQLLA